MGGMTPRPGVAENFHRLAECWVVECSGDCGQILKWYKGRTRDEIERHLDGEHGWIKIDADRWMCLDCIKGQRLVEVISGEAAADE